MEDSNLSEYEDIIEVISNSIYQEVKSRKSSAPEFTIPVEVSSRHVHVTRDVLDVLFGKDYELKKLKDLSQPGEFAAQEQVSIIGSNMKVLDRVRILGPVRKYSQAELSISDGYYLGLDLPTRISGNLKETPPISLIGPKGTLNLSQGAIRAARHIHMTPEDAKLFQVVNNDRVKVEVAGEHGVVFKSVIIRVSSNYKLMFHLDTDEGNAANIKGTGFARILSN